MPNNRVIWLTDRTRIVEGWKCPRKRYLAYHHGGRGVVSSQLQLELFMGLIIHDGLAAIATHHRDKQMVDIDLIAGTAAEQVKAGLGGKEDYVLEQATLIEGLLRGFHRHVWPRLMTQYPTIVAIEEEMTFQIDDSVRFMSRPDLILADPAGNLYYIEFKSTGNKKEAWVGQWDTAVQVHSAMKAVESTLGTLPTAAIIVGLYKGYVSYGKLSSPFVYGYKMQGQPPFRPDLFSYDYQKGYWRTPVWTLPGGVKKWVEDMPDDILSNQFPTTPPLFIKEDMVARFFSQTQMREHEIKLALQLLDETEDPSIRQQIMDVSFPQRFDMCKLGYGRSDEGIVCEYLGICHGSGEVGRGYIPREAHHTEEMEQHELDSSRNAD